MMISGCHGDLQRSGVVSTAGCQSTTLSDAQLSYLLDVVACLGASLYKHYIKLLGFPLALLYRHLPGGHSGQRTHIGTYTYR